MSRPFSIDPDDDTRPVGSRPTRKRPAATPEPESCRRCRRPVGDDRAYCPYCGASLRGPQSRSKARPVERAQPAPPPRPDDEDEPYAIAVDPDDPLDDADEVPYADVRRRPRRRPPRQPKPSDPGRLGPMFSGYVVMMAITVCFAVLLGVNMVVSGRLDEREQYWGMFAVEAIDTVLVLGVALLVGRIPPQPTSPQRKLVAWIGGFPLLAVLLALNIGFVLFVRRLFPDAEHEPPIPFTLITMLLVCLQPAVIEEWFFRHLALGSLREKWGVHWGVLISGALFASAHLMNPFGIPYLFLLGVALGYLRIWSGGLLLPMVLHFVHNAAVLLSAKWV